MAILGAPWTKQKQVFRCSVHQHKISIIQYIDNNTNNTIDNTTLFIFDLYTEQKEGNPQSFSKLKI